MGGHCAAADLLMVAQTAISPSPWLAPDSGIPSPPLLRMLEPRTAGLELLGQAVLLSLRRSKVQNWTWRFLHLAKKQCM